MGKNKNKLRKISLSLSIVVFAVFNFQTLKIVKASDSVDDLQDEQKSIQKELEKEQKELNAANANYSKVTAQVNTTSNLIKQTETEISRKEAEIKNLNDRITLFKKMLSAYLQEVYFFDQDPIIKLAIANDNLENVFGNLDRMSSAKVKILSIMDELSASQIKLAEVKVELAEKKEDHEKLLQQKKAEQGEIVEDIQESKATIAELQKKLAEVQSDLAKLTGIAFTAKDIREAVEFASDNTRVPKGVLYGFLGAETRFNANTGQCTYDKVKEDAIDLWYGSSSKWKASRDLLERRYGIFKEIVGALGYSKSKKVSCTPRSYRGQGGAMGVAQFMSDVWRGYEASIRAKTGHKNPDPWSITDGVMAMAIKLERAGATSEKSSVIKKASISYLGTFNQSYYNNIIYWSKNYKTLFPD